MTPHPQSHLDEYDDTCSTYPALRIITMPKDTNHYGVVFGGVILSYIDQAGFIEARKHGTHRWVTVALQEVDFHEPVHVGDTVNFWTRTIKTGTTSVTIEVIVQVERYDTGEIEEVTRARIIYVAVDANRNPIPFEKTNTL